jgi:hypothetical protein
MRNGFTTGEEIHWDPCGASCPVKMHDYPVRRIGIQEIGEAAASLLEMDIRFAA